MCLRPIKADPTVQRSGMNHPRYCSGRNSVDQGPVVKPLFACTLVWKCYIVLYARRWANMLFQATSQREV